MATSQATRMAPRLCTSCVAFLLKLLTCAQAFVGLSLVLRSLWLLNRWHHQEAGSSGLDLSLSPLHAPWLVYFFMGAGVLMCLVAFTGYIAAEAISNCCLYFVFWLNYYAISTVMLLFMEATLVVDLVFNKKWQEELPEDATGELKHLRALYEANIILCKSIAMAVVLVQALAFVLSMILRRIATPKTEDYDSDGSTSSVHIKTPLLNRQGGCDIASNSVDSAAVNSDTWSARLRQKYGLNASSETNYTNASPE